MFDHIEARDALNAAIDYRREVMRDTTRRLIAALRADIRHGPVYHWQDGGPQGWGEVDPDRPYRTFCFGTVLASVRERLEAEELDAPVTETVYHDEYDEDDNLVEYETEVEVADRETVLRALVGPDLARML